jgi:NAD(P)-dependent dehydrogenase (short-subunit alcohol dehydrogenase family)
VFDLGGRVALVTGAGRGVGAGIALAMASQGAAVAVNDLFEERAAATADAIAAVGARAAAIPFDVTDHEATRGGFEAAAAELNGPVDILVNNAGIPAAGMRLVSFRDSDPELWRRFVDLNLYGVLNCTHAAVGGMCDRGWGRIITISSEAGRRGVNLKISLYGAAKAGAIGFMRHLALEVARDGVTANCIALGQMDNVPTEWAERVAPTVPLGRLGSPADAGAAAVFLASDEAGWVTGQVLPVNGGSMA